MIKKAIILSFVVAQIGSAYASVENINGIEKVANEYMSSISGGSPCKPVKILTLGKDKIGERRYAVIYSDIPTGDSIGANGNMGMQFVEVHSDVFSTYYVDEGASTPNITFSGWPIVKYISNTENKMIVDVRAFSPTDPQSCMSYVYRETLVRGIHKNWSVADKKLISDHGCGTEG